MRVEVTYLRFARGTEAGDEKKVVSAECRGGRGEKKGLRTEC